MSDGNINSKKRPPTRVDRDSPEANVEERSQPYDELGQTDEEIRKKQQLYKHQERERQPGAVPTEGS